MSFTPKQQLQLWRAWIERWAELTLDEIDRDLAAIEHADQFCELFLAARWAETAERLSRCSVSRTEAARVDDITDSDDLEHRWALMCKHYGEQLGAPASQLPVDVEKRLEWMKRRVAQDYEQTVRKAMDINMITSPIEQLFLLEWHYQRAGEVCGVTLHPQQRVETSSGEYVIDFVVRAKATDQPRGAVAIELDGHDFHEKTKDQVAKDKKRERAIVRSGLPVLRFSGHEIWKDVRACVHEVVDYFRP